MIPFKQLGICAFALVLAGCAAHRAPSRFEGKPVSEAVNAMPKRLQQSGITNDGKPYYYWIFDEVETVTFTDSYAYHNTDRPGMTTGLYFYERELPRKCSVVVVYDDATQIVTDFQVNKTRNAKCRKMESYLDGSAYKPGFLLQFKDPLR